MQAMLQLASAVAGAVSRPTLRNRTAMDVMDHCINDDTNHFVDRPAPHRDVVRIRDTDSSSNAAGVQQCCVCTEPLAADKRVPAGMPALLQVHVRFNCGHAYCSS